MTSLSLSKFPLLASGTSESRKAQLAQALSNIGTGIERGAISNPEFQEAKRRLNDSIASAWSRHISDQFFNSGKYLAQPPMIQELHWEINPDGVHMIASALKKVNAAAALHSNFVIESMRAFLNEVSPLVDAMALIKPLVVKRKTKTEDERQLEKQFVAPKGAEKTVLVIKKILEDVTKEHYDGLISDLIKVYNRQVDTFLGTAKDARKKNWPSLVYRCVKSYGTLSNKKWTKKDDSDAIISAQATKDADEIREAFVFKNLKKLVSIVDTKGNLAKAEIIEGSVSMAGLRGTFLISFEDGSHFIARNSAVLSYSIHNRAFRRFPLTFHNVVLPGGMAMKQPSEERMNTVFITGQEAAADDSSPSL